MSKENNSFPQLEWQDTNGHPHCINVLDRLYIGRVCQGVPADKCIIVSDASVSRDHAVITYSGSDLTIKDSSRNGSRINGVRMTSGGEQKLQPGDVVDIGSLTLHVIITEPPNIYGESDELEQVDTTRVLSLHETVTHLVADIRGFSTVAQRTESSLLFEVLSKLYDTLTNIVHENHGTVKDFAGDAIFAFWEHTGKDNPMVAQNACRAALSQEQAAMALFSGLPDKFSELRHLQLGWGIATGPATLSHYGVRTENLALVGDSTNLAFRLAGLANKELSSAIVICHKTADMVKSDMAVEPLGDVDTKGREGKEVVFSIS